MERGFIFREEGFLDLRMNLNVGILVYVRLFEMSEIEIEYMLIENVDEIYVKEIVKEIIKVKI